MLEISLNVFDEKGVPRPKKDWILPQMAKKFKHFHDACGLMDKYETGELSPDDVMGKTGQLIIKLEPYTNKDGLEIISAKIDDYVKRVEKVKSKSKKAADLDDEIPF